MKPCELTKPHNLCVITKKFGLKCEIAQPKLNTESFHVICLNLLTVRVWTDPDLLSLIIFYLFELSRILDIEANQRRCPRGSHDA